MLLDGNAIPTTEQVDAFESDTVDQQQAASSIPFRDGQQTEVIVQSSMLLDDSVDPKAHELVNANAASSSCRETGPSHTRLIEFGIGICPKSHDSLPNKVAASQSADNVPLPVGLL